MGRMSTFTKRLQDAAAADHELSHWLIPKKVLMQLSMGLPSGVYLRWPVHIDSAVGEPLLGGLERPPADLGPTTSGCRRHRGRFGAPGKAPQTGRTPQATAAGRQTSAGRCGAASPATHEESALGALAGSHIGARSGRNSWPTIGHVVILIGHIKWHGSLVICWGRLPCRARVAGRHYLARPVRGSWSTLLRGSQIGP